MADYQGIQPQTLRQIGEESTTHTENQQPQHNLAKHVEAQSVIQSGQEQEHAQQAEPVEQPQVQSTSQENVEAHIQVEPQTIPQQTVEAQPQVVVQQILQEPVYTARQRIADSNAMKEKGNQEFKNGEYISSIHHYLEGLKTLDQQAFRQAPQEVNEEARTLIFSLLLNLAMSHLKLSNFDQAVLCSSQALKLNPKSFKALYRRANAYYSMGKYQQALTDIKLAYEVDSTSPQGNQSYRKIFIAYSAEKKEKEDKQRQLYKNMFKGKPQSSPTKSVETPETETTVSGQNSFLKMLLYGCIGAGAMYYFAKQAEVSDETEQIIQVAGSGISASLLGTVNPVLRTVGVLGIGAIAGYIYFKK